MGRRAALPDARASCNSALMAKIHTVEWTPGHPRDPGAQGRDARQLVRRAARSGPSACRASISSRALRGRRRRAGAPRRAVRDHRGVRLRLPAAPADRRRLGDPLAPHRRADRARRSSSTSRARRRATSIDEYGWSDLFYSFGVSHPGAITPAQPPARAVEPDARQRRPRRPRDDRRPARPRARRPALQRLPREAAQAAHQEARGHLRQPGVGGRDPRRLRRRHRPSSTCRSACWPRSRRRASASATPRSGSSS